MYLIWLIEGKSCYKSLFLYLSLSTLTMIFATVSRFFFQACAYRIGGFVFLMAVVLLVAPDDLPRVVRLFYIVQISKFVAA